MTCPSIIRGEGVGSWRGNVMCPSVIREVWKCNLSLHNLCD